MSNPMAGILDEVQEMAKRHAVETELDIMEVWTVILATAAASLTKRVGQLYVKNVVNDACKVVNQ